MTELLVKFAIVAFVTSGSVEVAKRAFPAVFQKEVPRWARVLAPVTLGVAAFAVMPVASVTWFGWPGRLLAGFLAGTTSSWSYEIFEKLFRRKTGAV